MIKKFGLIHWAGLVVAGIVGIYFLSFIIYFFEFYNTKAHAAWYGFTTFMLLIFSILGCGILSITGLVMFFSTLTKD